MIRDLGDALPLVLAYIVAELDFGRVQRAELGFKFIIAEERRVIADVMLPLITGSIFSLILNSSIEYLTAE